MRTTEIMPRDQGAIVKPISSFDQMANEEVMCAERVAHLRDKITKRLIAERIVSGNEELNELARPFVDAIRACDRTERLNAVRDDLPKCRSHRPVVELLHEYGKPLGILKIRYHRWDRATNKLILTASAGLDPEFESQIRYGGFVKNCQHLPLEFCDTMWPFKNAKPTLFEVKEDVDPHLRSFVGPHGIDTVHIREEQCTILKGFKGNVWVDFPFKVGDVWKGKLSCDISREAPAEPGFFEKVMAFWVLVQAAAVYLDHFTVDTNCEHEEWTPSEHEIGAVRGDSRSGSTDTLQYQSTHGDLDVAAIAEGTAYLAARNYAGKLIAIDGGETNLEIADAIGKYGKNSVGTVVTNNLDIPARIPSGDGNPTVEVCGGKVRRKPGKPAAVVGDSDLVRHIHRTWRFAACIVGAAGIKPPFLFTESGQELDIKRAFMRRSTDIIVPLPSFKWSRDDGKVFLDLRKGCLRNGGDPTGTLYLVTVFPHKDATAPPVIWRKLAYTIHGNFIDGVRSIADYSTQYPNLMGVVHYFKAAFSPERGRYPSIEPIKVEHSRDISPDEIYKRINPQGRIDIRLVVIIALSLTGARTDGGNELQVADIKVTSLTEHQV
jgi:hypothetical protein